MTDDEVAGPVRVELDALRPGDVVTLIDLSGARFAGTVMGRRPEDPGDEVPLRRVGGGVHFVKHSRIREVERG